MIRVSQRQTGCPDGIANETVEPVEESRGTRVVLEMAPDGDCFMDDLEGVIVNSEPAAVRWAEAWYERYRDAALPMVDAMTDDD